MSTPNKIKAGARTQHTPGPWLAVENQVVPVGTGTMRICTCTDQIPKTQTKANAHLIAAAPDMLKTLKLFVGFASSGKHPKWASYLDTQAGFNMKLAISKAEGRAQ